MQARMTKKYARERDRTCLKKEEKLDITGNYNRGSKRQVQTISQNLDLISIFFGDKCCKAILCLNNLKKVVSNVILIVCTYCTLSCNVEVYYGEQWCRAELCFNRMDETLEQHPCNLGLTNTTGEQSVRFKRKTVSFPSTDGTHCHSTVLPLIECVAGLVTTNS